jgi:hypothetical protein
VPFRRKISSPSSWLNSKPSNKSETNCIWEKLLNETTLKYGFACSVKRKIEHINTHITDTEIWLSSEINVSFISDVCEAVIAANIPPDKMNSKNFRDFLKNTCVRNVPKESSPRNIYLNKCYSSALRHIRENSLSLWTENTVPICLQDLRDCKLSCSCSLCMWFCAPAMARRKELR